MITVSVWSRVNLVLRNLPKVHSDQKFEETTNVTHWFLVIRLSCTPELILFLTSKAGNVTKTQTDLTGKVLSSINRVD